MPRQKRVLSKINKYIIEFGLAGWVVIVLYLHLPFMYDQLNGTTITAKLYYISCGLAVIYGLLDMRATRFFIASWFGKWLLFTLGLFLLNLARLHLTETPPDQLSLETDRFERFLMFPFVAFLCLIVNKSNLVFFLKLAVIVGPVGLVLDFLYPELFGADDTLRNGRADGFYGNANPAAEAALLCLVLASRFMSRSFLIFAYIAVGIGVTVTFSRSGIGMWIIFGLLLIANRQLPKITAVLPVLFFIGISTFAPQLGDFLETLPGAENRVQELVGRLTFWGETNVTEITTDSEKVSERGAIGVASLTAVLERPILGHGLSYTDSVTGEGSHNQLLSLWYKFGILGAISWLWLVAILLIQDTSANRWIRPAAVAFVWYSFFTHNMFEHAFWLVFLPLVVFMNTQFSRRSSQRSKNIVAKYQSPTPARPVLAGHSAANPQQRKIQKKRIRKKRQRYRW